MSEYQEVNRRSRKAGIQGAEATAVALHSRFREGDDTLQQIMLVSFRAGLLEPLVSPRLGLGLIAGNIVSTTGRGFGRAARCAIQWQRRGTSDSPSQALVGIAEVDPC